MKELEFSSDSFFISFSITNDISNYMTECRFEDLAVYFNNMRRRNIKFLYCFCMFLGKKELSISSNHFVTV